MSQIQITPAMGLKKLTQEQIKRIDAEVADACTLTVNSKQDAQVIIYIHNGVPRKISRSLSAFDLKPL